MTRKCLKCQNEIINGRIDKKFCSDSCRNNYNNEIKKPRRNLIRNVNHKLNKNENILFELNINPDKKTTVSIQNLTEKSFDFEFFTSLNVENKITYFCVYDQCYTNVGNGKFLISHKDKLVKIDII